MTAAPPPICCACAAQALDPQVDWLRLVGGLRGRPHLWWLDSARQLPGLGRYSFAGADPYALIWARGERSEIHWLRRPADGPEVEERQGPPLDALRAWLPPRPLPDPDLPDLPFLGGAVGVFGYELAGTWDPAPAGPRDDLGLPDLCWLLVDRLYARDHLRRRSWAVALGFAADPRRARRRAVERARSVASRLPDGEPAPQPLSAGFGLPPALPQCGDSLDAVGYQRAVARLLERIRAGDVYQACLTRRLEVPFHGDPWRLYGALRSSSPAPFAAYLELPGAQVVGSSPERFLALGPGRWAESRPMKGTRPRRRDPRADRAERASLWVSEKDRAENLMIVDLVRNDLGRVCETGSVHVPALWTLEAYATVFQMVSTVRGRLRADRDVLELIAACFPPGSMTGAPKRAAMGLLAELEPLRRGWYSGALGFLDARGGCGLCVVIRTLILKDGRAVLQTGGGIVADSEPQAEWRESEDKARALEAALAAAGDLRRPA